jgi:non-ribosomal peptide synthetase component F
MESFSQSNIINSTDRVLQVAASSFDAHDFEIIGPLSLGGTLVMIKPNGTRDMHYFIETIQRQNVTFMLLVPSFISLLHEYHMNNKDNAKSNYRFGSIRTLAAGG